MIGRGWLTSKRSRSGAISEPFCVTCVAEPAAQRLMQQMGGGVVGADGAAAGVVDLELDRVADLQRAALDRAEMDEQVAEPASACRYDGDAAGPPGPVIVPVSPTWPPLSA